MTKTADRYLPVLILSLFIAVFPHFFRFSPWIVMFMFLFWGYALVASLKGWDRINRPLLVVTAIGGFLMVGLTYRGRFDTDAYVSLLMIMAALKPMETGSYRDRMVTLFIAYFLIITNLFYSDALVMTLYMLFSVLTTTTVLVHLHRPTGRRKASIRLAATLMLQAMPLLAVLFLLFPRIQGGFFGLSRGIVGTSGFSDRMSPGSISGMIQDPATAFRASFQGTAPPPSDRYWRGIVFDFFDGRTWRKGYRRPLVETAVTGKRPVTVQITLEPHKGRWLFALDMPAAAPESGIQMDDFTLQARRNVNRRTLYQVTSYPEYTALGASGKKAALQLPKQGNLKARDLAQTWAKRASDPEDIIASALAFLKNGGFRYSLNPPLLGADPIDEFLFKTKKGYCEHYASAFAFLMRASGIPARVVGGYLGGELNPFGGYLIVRQSDAHAWVEVWLPEKGWIRTDPTAVVSPERITQGLREALSLEEYAQLKTLPDLGAISDIFTSMELGWDMINNHWTLWVMGYTRQDQWHLLEKIGIPPGLWRGHFFWFLFLAATGTVCLALLLMITGRRRRLSGDPTHDAYNRFCKKLAKAGLPRTPAQGPVDYADRVIAARSDLRKEVMAITRLYIQLRYGRNGTARRLKALKTWVRKFSP